MYSGAPQTPVGRQQTYITAND